MSYISLHKSQLLDSLESQVLYADLCSVIVGKLGIGKSYFIEQLVLRLAGQVHPSQIQAHSEISVQQLEKAIVLQLGLSWKAGDESLIDKIQAKLEQRVLLIIDDAQLLPVECLDFLMQIVSQQFSEKNTLIYLVLVGEPSLAEKLSKTYPLQENPNICAVFELQPIKESETRHFVAEYQAIDIGTTEAIYDAQKLRYFWQLSSGIPGEIEYQLNRWLVESSHSSEKIVPEKSSKKYWLTGVYVLVAIVLILILFNQDEINEKIAGKESSPAAVKEEVHQLDLGAMELQIERQNANKNTRKSKLTELPQSTIPSPEVDSPGILTKPTIEPSTQQNSKPSSVSEKQEPSIEHAVNKEIDEQQLELNQSIPLPKESLNKMALTDDEKTLIDLDDSQFTLQWVGVSSQSAAELFRENHPLKQQMRIYRRKQEKGYLFLIVTGEFNSRDDAEHTRIVYLQRDYPGKAWIKTIKAVKQEISSLR